MKLYSGRNNEIRRVMRKFSLRVNRLQRIQYGPFTIGDVPNPGDIQEVKVSQEMRKLLYRYYKAKTNEATQMVEEAEQDKKIKEAKKREK